MDVTLSPSTEFICFNVTFVLCFLLFNYINRMFSFNRLYEQFEEFLVKNDSLRYKVKYGIIYLLINAYFIRCLLYALKGERLFGMIEHQYEFVVFLVRFINSDVHDPFLLNTITLILFIPIIGEYYFIYENKEQITWQIYKDVTLKMYQFYIRAKLPIESVQSILYAKFQKLSQNSYLPNFMIYFRCKLEIMFNFENVDREKFVQPKMETFEPIDFRSRRRAVITLLLLQVGFASIRIVLCE